MDLGTLLGLGLSAFTAIAGAIYAYGKLNERVKDNTAELEQMTKRVERAEDAATKVSGLASAVESMGQRFADRIEHLVQVMDLHNQNTREQLTEIKQELGHVRANAAMAKELASRRAPSRKAVS